MIEISSDIPVGCINPKNNITNVREFNIELYHPVGEERYEVTISDFDFDGQRYCIDFSELISLIDEGEYEYRIYSNTDIYVDCGILKYYNSYIISYSQDRKYIQYEGR